MPCDADPAADRRRAARMSDMEKRHITLATGATLAFDIAAPASGEVFIALGLRKCGSSIMFSMLTDLAGLNGVNFVDVAGRFFAANVAEPDWRRDPAVLGLLAPGNLFGGFRAMPLVLARSTLYQQARKILLVRDPRDALVSEYFSNAYSHAVPDAPAGAPGARADFLALRQAALSTDIEAAVLARAPAMNTAFLEYAECVADPRTKLFRYEDVILQKRRWLRDMAAHFGWESGSDAFIEGMMSWADVIPGEERAENFIRKVVPGDHRAKLGAAVIGRLDAILAPALALFGYR